MPLLVCRGICIYICVNMSSSFHLEGVRPEPVTINIAHLAWEHENSLLCDRCACEQIQMKRMPF